MTYLFKGNTVENDLIPIEAEDKKDALKKFNEKYGTNYKFVTGSKFYYKYAVIAEEDYRHYNYSKYSYID
jgi:hypothetical protein